MSTSLALRPSVRAALAKLIDYAGLFPPARLAMEPALAEYAEARRSPHAWMVGRFIVPASRASELIDGLGEVTAPIALSVIADATPDARGWFADVRRVLAEIAQLREERSDLRIEALEVPLPGLVSARETHDASIGQLGAMLHQCGLGDLPAYVELPRAAQWEGLLPGATAALRRAHLDAKLRCGGVAAEAYPSPAEVAAFVTACVEYGVPFKATAGLHHPVRHFNARAGVTMHGFLNLLAAAVFAERLDGPTLEQVVAEEDPGAFAFDDDAFAWRGLRASTDELAAARRGVLVAYGSCSVREPVDDLVAAGILPEPA